MKPIAAVCRAGVACLSLLAIPLLVQGEPLQPALVVPGDVVWVRNPLGFETGKVAGDLAKPGMYANRVRFPAGLRVQPHFHPDERIVVVVSGTMYVGYGERFDEAEMKALPAGSVWTEPARQPHFAWAKDGEVVIQVIGNGPSGNTPIPQKE